MLTLPIKKGWYDLIAGGVKKEEYREIKPYYTTRFRNLFGAMFFLCVRAEKRRKRVLSSEMDILRTRRSLWHYAACGWEKGGQSGAPSLGNGITYWK